MTTLKIVREASLNCEKNRLSALCKSLVGQWTGHQGNIDSSKSFVRMSIWRDYATNDAVYCVRELK